MTDALFAGVKWTCMVCGDPPGCNCWEKCECGVTNRRGEECRNQVWHVARGFAEDIADAIVADMAHSYKLFQRDHMVARLKRAVIRQAHPMIIETFEGVEAAKRKPVDSSENDDSAE